ncbi:hypothetical protein AB0958_21830 [Streptomyces sp. NPDC006655]|uniref:hypothetical protein n=1 Tax=Streptomyces sp. NPDC006655 TaxID=3156898 RepID=UPI003455A274
MGEFGAVVKGVKEVSAKLGEMQVASNEGTRVALRKATSYTRSRIKGGMRGRPRWAHKGPDKATGAPGFNIHRAPDHVKRTGGPGVLTGDLQRSIRTSRKPRPEGVGKWSQVVMSGGKGGYQNRYKAKIEGEYPFFKPGVDKATPKVREFFVGAWAAATNGKRGG